MDDELHTSNFEFRDKKRKTRYGNSGIIPCVKKLEGVGGVDLEMESKNDVEENEFSKFLPPRRKSKNQEIGEQDEQMRKYEQEEMDRLQQRLQHSTSTSTIPPPPPPSSKKKEFLTPLSSILKSSKNVLSSTKTTTDFETFVRFVLPLIFFIQLVILFRVYFKK